MPKILAYGTLRETEYNFERVKRNFGPNSIKKIGFKKLSGYSMYNLGYYPAVCKTNTTDEILVDILEVNEEAANFINTMELGAGYEVEDIEGSRLYVYGTGLSDDRKINSGDWLNRE